MRSKIGLILNPPEATVNPMEVRTELERDTYIRKIHNRQCSEFNKRHLENQEHEVQPGILRQRAKTFIVTIKIQDISPSGP